MNLTAEAPSVANKPSYQMAFRVLDPELPVLAASAAMELDSLISRHGDRVGIDGNSTRLDSVKKLASLVGQVTPTDDLMGPSRRSLMDPVSTTVFVKAYSATISTNALKSHADLATAAQRLIELFGKAESNPLNDLKVLRDFCARLSNFAAIQRQSMQSSRPSPSHKK